MSLTLNIEQPAKPERFPSKDTGCKIATKFLGHQSRCLSCPYAECLEDTNQTPVRIDSKQKDEAIIERRKQGVKYSDLAIEFGITDRTIHRIIARRVS